MHKYKGGNMDIKKEIKNLAEKILDEKKEIIENISLNDIEKNLKKEIKKGNLVLQNEMDSLKNEIEKSNKEAENLKKENYKLIKDLKKRNQLLINILQNYSVINTLSLSKDDKDKIKLVLEKENYLLTKESIETLAKIGEVFNPKYHEVLNSTIEKKESYIIEKVIEQGYKENGEILKYAKVIVK